MRYARPLQLILGLLVAAACNEAAKRVHQDRVVKEGGGGGRVVVSVRAAEGVQDWPVTIAAFRKLLPSSVP